MMGIRTSIFIIPRASTDWRGNEAGWITASGWASAGQELWGEALVATTDGVFSPQESITFPRQRENAINNNKWTRLRSIIPEVLITGLKDWKLMRAKPSKWPIETSESLAGKKVMMVWQRHDLFPGPGRRLADQFGVPLVTSVEAPVVWEARKWGVKRPVWGKWLETNVEARSLKESDLVSCVSNEVRDQVIRMGVPPAKAIVSPNRVDSTVFHPDIKSDEISAKYNLDGRRVIGWTGSFRAFHGLDTLLLAFKEVNEQFSDTTLMLVGDGFEMEKIRKMAKDLNLENQIIFTGRVPLSSIPAVISNFNIALVTASSGEGFHYSPLKLREYLAMGMAVVAPRAGDLSRCFQDGEEVLLFEPGNFSDLASKIKSLIVDDKLFSNLQNGAIEWFYREGTWTFELKKICDRLNLSYFEV